MMSVLRDSSEGWRHCHAVVRPALRLAPSTYLQDLQDRLAADGVQVAVVRRDTATLFDWIVRLLARQGIGNHAAEVFLARHGGPTFAEIAELMDTNALCPRLRCHWAFEGCRYRRSTGSCGTPHHRVGCPVTLIPARKGALAEAAIGLWLFIRDCCGGDFVNWIDQRLAAADAAADYCHRGAHLRGAVLEPLAEITGTGRKVWSMILAELLLGADPGRKRWVATGASFVAVDSLVHAFLHRTGILRCLNGVHTYGPACYAPGGCAEVIAALADRIDAREFSPAYPTVFPRWVQFALWWFCAADGWSTCNANQIDDRVGCRQRFCASFTVCDRLPLPALPLAISL